MSFFLPEVQIHHIGYSVEAVLHKLEVLEVPEILQQMEQLQVEMDMELLQVGLDKEAVVVVYLFPLFLKIGPDLIFPKLDILPIKNSCKLVIILSGMLNVIKID